MRRSVFIVYLFLMTEICSAQWYGYHFEDNTELDAGMGVTWIGDQIYYAMGFQPDIRVGNLGIGLGIIILFNSNTGKIRSRDWNSVYDLARIIRYIRYGYDGDPVYSRLGVLDRERIGHGFILNYYNNQIYYDERKIGMSVDLNFRRFGFESITNNLGRLEVVGGRGYVRPFYFFKNSILEGIGIGATCVADFDPDSRTRTDSRVVVWGLDAELSLIESELLRGLLYADYAKIENHGSGQCVGFRTEFNGPFDFLRLTISVERRLLGREFLPSYFGPFYEILRWTTLAELWEYYEYMGGSSSDEMVFGLKKYYSFRRYDVSLLPDDFEGFIALVGSWPASKELLLSVLDKRRCGWYADLSFDFLNLIRLSGSFQIIDGNSSSGILHVSAELSSSVPFVTMEATYDKRGISKFGDIGRLDYMSFARIGAGCRITPYLLLYLDYIWYYDWDADLGKAGAYVPRERLMPRLALRHRFNGF